MCLLKVDTVSIGVPETVFTLPGLDGNAASNSSEPVASWERDTLNAEGVLIIL